MQDRQDTGKYNTSLLMRINSNGWCVGELVCVCVDAFKARFQSHFIFEKSSLINFFEKKNLPLFRKALTHKQREHSGTRWSTVNIVLDVAGLRDTKQGWFCVFWHFEGGCRKFHKMEKLMSGPVITNHSFSVPKMLSYVSKLGNSFINKIKTNKIQGRKIGWPSAI